jgi:hypothetical protein
MPPSRSSSGKLQRASSASPSRNTSRKKKRKGKTKKVKSNKHPRKLDPLVIPQSQPMLVPHRPQSSPAAYHRRPASQSATHIATSHNSRRVLSASVVRSASRTRPAPLAAPAVKPHVAARFESEKDPFAAEEDDDPFAAEAKQQPQTSLARPATAPAPSTADDDKEYSSDEYEDDFD